MRLKRRVAFWLLAASLTVLTITALLYYSRPPVRPMLAVSQLVRTSNQTKPIGLTAQSYRIVHFDLKGAPPKMSFLHELLLKLSAEGADALLIEYEDTFPFYGQLANLSSGNAYSSKQIRTLLTWAHDLYMEVIPLIQTFGHLEMALKLEEFKHLRELDPFPMELCPSKDGSLKLVEMMIKQVMEMHPQARYLHIGCDEVFHLAACPICSSQNPKDLYTRHVISVSSLVRELYPTVTCIIWDDMIRQWPPHYLATSPITGHVEPMVWAYARDVSTLIKRQTWYWYNKVFPRIWVAGAFKGATHPTSILPSTYDHYENQKSWVQYVKQDTSVPIGGIVLTGWSRYDHFGGLCELMAVSVPSLLLSLLAVTNRSSGDLMSSWADSMSCPPIPPNRNLTSERIARCTFPGVDLYNMMLQFMAVRQAVHHTLLKLDRSGWITPYHIKYNVSNPLRLVEILGEAQLNLLSQRVGEFSISMSTEMLRYYDQVTVSEWIEQNVTPLNQGIDSAAAKVQSLMLRSVWPRRPFH